MSSIRVLLTSGIFPPDKGGPAHFVSTYSKWLASSGVDTSVFSLTDGDSVVRDESGVRVTLLSRGHALPIRFILTSLKITKASLKKKVVLLNGLFLESLLALYITRTNFIVKVPGDIVWERARNQGLTTLAIDQYQGAERGGKKIFRFLFTSSLKKAKVIIAPSLHLKKLIEGWGVNPNKILLVRNSVDTSLFSPDQNITKRFDVITVCRLVPWKGVDELIIECSKRGLSLAIVGDGPERANLEKLAVGQGGPIEFFGDVSHANLPELLNASKIFVLNSSYEGSPHALIEALAIGVIAIARQSTGSSEVIDDLSNGLLSGELRSLGACLDLLQSDSILAARLRDEARLTALKEYDQEVAFNKIKATLESEL